MGNNTVLHIADFPDSDNPEYEVLSHIIQELTKYEYSIGWYTTGIALYHEDTQEYLDGIDSDLAVLHSRCIANEIDSIINLISGIPYINGQTHIDLHSIFGKPMVQTSIFRNAYRTLKLDDVSRAVLKNDNVNGDGAGKYKQLTGGDIHELSVEEQKAYVLRDAELVMRLSKHNNSEVLDAMKAVAEITGLDFERVCRSGISTWWAAIYDQAILNGECQLYYSNTTNSNTKSLDHYDYKGAIVLKPKRGVYRNLVVVDVVSLYPSMALLNNISFDTVNCECCIYNLDARIPGQISMILNSDQDNKIDNRNYWICRRSEGIFPKKLRVFKNERIRQKELGNSEKQLALKILINGGYGVFGSRFFKYRDLRVAELITAYGRYTLTKMQGLAEEMGLQVVYGDTDSLFIDLYGDKQTDSDIVNGYILEFKEKCKKHLGIDIEHAKTYKTSIISDKKKHYIGWTGISGTSPDIIGMEGDKNDRPRWINNVFRQIVDEVLGIHNNSNNTDPISTVKKSISELENGNVDHKLLTRSVRLSKNPEDYHNTNDRKRRLGLAIGARKGDVIEYYESDNKEGYSLNYREISYRKYRLMLWKAIKELLEIAGYDVGLLEKEIEVTSIGR